MQDRLVHDTDRAGALHRGLDRLAGVAPPGAQELAAAEPIVRVIDNPTGKTPVALNAAITASTAPIIARIDARAVIPIGYLTLAVDTLTESGAANVGAVQNPVGFLPASARLPRQWPRSWALVGLVTGGAM